MQCSCRESMQTDTVTVAERIYGYYLTQEWTPWPLSDLQGALPEFKEFRGITSWACTQDHRMVWVDLQRSSSPKPLPSFTRPGFSKTHATWLWALWMVGHPQLLWKTHSTSLIVKIILVLQNAHSLGCYGQHTDSYNTNTIWE